MNSVKPGGRYLLSGNEAVAQAIWEAGVTVTTAYPGTPATEILETAAGYPDIDAHWSVNEKVALEVAIGASLAGARAVCSMKHVGMNVAADALMSQTLAGTLGGLAIVVADDVGLSSSQNEQDSRYWGRFAHLPILEPADAQEAYELTRRALDLSERCQAPVIVRLTTRVCHVKSPVTLDGVRQAHHAGGFRKDPQRWVLTPTVARTRLLWVLERDGTLKALSEAADLNVLIDGPDRRVGFIASGPAYLHVREAFPRAPVLKLGFSHPPPLDKIRALAAQVEYLVVAEETEPLLETEIRAAGIPAHGKDILPRTGELVPAVLLPAVKQLLGEDYAAPAVDHPAVFPRPPTLCPSCPHLGPYYALSHIRNLTIVGDIGCYTLGAGHPWKALDTTTCMGASMGMALGMDKGRGEADAKRQVLAVIGDSTFLHMGMQGLLDIVYQRGKITVLLLDNRSVAMTGGQPNPASGRDIHDHDAPRLDFAKLVEALGVKPERIHKVDPYELPTLLRTIRQEIKIPEPSVIITTRPCSLTDWFEPHLPYQVLEDRCTGCGNCLTLGCPAIAVSRRETVIKPSGQERELSFVRIDPYGCTGCGLCVATCAPQAIVGAAPVPSPSSAGS